MRSSPVLLIEPNDGLRSMFEELKLREGFAFREADGANYVELFQRIAPALIVVGSGDTPVRKTMEIVRRVRDLNSQTPLILVPSCSSEDLAIAALKAGVNDYLKPPVSARDLSTAIGRYLPDESYPDPIIGQSSSIMAIKERIRSMSSSHSNVLITGETGTGKELVAQMIHSSSPRSDHPLVCVNCAAIPEALFESELFGYEKGAFTGAQISRHGKLRMAHRGSVFLDEIGDMSPFAQAKILRAIETKNIQPLGSNSSIPLDVRVIAATNQSLEEMMGDGRFRKDLYFRLDVVRIHLPPLRERKEDIPLLIHHYLNTFGPSSSGGIEMLGDDALDSLLAHDWPGNIRELKNVLEAVFVSAPRSRVSFTDLPEGFRNRTRRQPTSPTNPTSDDRQRLLSALLAANWNKSKAAARLSWSRMTVYRKMAKYHIVERDVTAV